MKRDVRKRANPGAGDDWSENEEMNVSVRFPRRQSHVLIDTIVPFITRKPIEILQDADFYYNMCPFVKQRITSLPLYSGCMSVRVCLMSSVRIPEKAFHVEKTKGITFGVHSAALEFMLVDALFQRRDDEVFSEIQNLMSHSMSGTDFPKFVLSSVFKSPDSAVPEMVYIRKRKLRDKGTRANNRYFVSSLYAEGEKNSYAIECRML